MQKGSQLNAMQVSSDVRFYKLAGCIVVNYLNPYKTSTETGFPRAMPPHPEIFMKFPDSMGFDRDFL